MTPPGENKILELSLLSQNQTGNNIQYKKIGLSHGYVVLPYSLCNKWCP